MEVIIGTIIYTLGQGIAFNVVLPIWYLILQLTKAL